MKVAYIEDDRVWRKSVAEVLSYDGFNITPFAEKPESVSELSIYDIIIADNRLRATTDSSYGIDLLHQLRHAGYNGILILYTSFPNEDLYKRCDGLDVYLISKKDRISTALKSVLLSEQEHSGFA